jgi:hypothetical protein
MIQLDWNDIRLILLGNYIKEERAEEIINDMKAQVEINKKNNEK